MKSMLKLLPLALLALALFVAPTVTHAQDAAAPAASATVTPPASDVAPSTGNVTADSVVQWLTPIIVPLIIAGVKKVAPKIPSAFLPLIAPVLGVVIGLIAQLASGHSSNLWVAAGLGLLGVAVREVKEAFKPADNGGWPSTP